MKNLMCKLETTNCATLRDKPILFVLSAYAGNVNWIAYEQCAA